jgi:hypothetical protein
MIHLPYISVFNIIACFLPLLQFMSGFEEKNGVNIPYGRFAISDKGEQIDSKRGMLVIYTPALLCAYLYLSLMTQYDLQGLMVVMCLFIHFSKRVYEVLRVHIYSGNMALNACLMISISYAINTALICKMSTELDYYVKRDNMWVLLGMLLFVIGEIGNYTCHQHLRMFRIGQREHSSYVYPYLGLYTDVISPHYGFEIIAWYGIALVSGQLYTLLVAVSMTNYLYWRADATRKWYIEKFPEHRELTEQKYLLMTLKSI